MTRLTAADLRVELFRTAIAAVSQTGVEFHRSQPDQQASLTVIPGGGVVFTFVAGAEPTSPTGPPATEEPDRAGQSSRLPDRLPQTAAEPAADSTGPQVPPPTVDVPASPPPGRAKPSPTRPRLASPAAASTEPEQAPRVQLTGRLGRDPSFRTTTKTGTLVGRFPLAEHHADGTTRWYHPLAHRAGLRRPGEAAATAHPSR